ANCANYAKRLPGLQAGRAPLRPAQAGWRVAALRTTGQNLWACRCGLLCPLHARRALAMPLTDFVRGVPDDVWAEFEPALPPVVWQGNGRKPWGNRDCLHALLYVLAAGIGWEYLPPCFPSPKTVQRRLKVWLAHDLFRAAWAGLAERY